MRVELNLTGAAAFVAENEATAAAISQAVDTLLSATGARLEADAKILCPVDTGNLRNSIFTNTTRDGDTHGVEVGPSANYGSFLEDGTSRMRPQPYMGPAFERASQQFLAGMTAIAAGATLR